VISGVIRCRQPILRLAEAVDEQGLKCCDIIMAPGHDPHCAAPEVAVPGMALSRPKDAPADIGPAGFAEEGGSPGWPRNWRGSV
jgi:hypothetical protein